MVLIVSGTVYRIFTHTLKGSSYNHTLCKSSINSLIPVLCANISSKSFRDQSKKRPPPFPYKEKRYTLLRSWFDRTTHRFDENSKIIVVDGPIAAGKTALAKSLAEELDMYYMPEANMDMYYINDYGYDLRKVDPKLPESLKSYDIRNFCQNPHHPNAAFFQFMMYKLRYGQYVDALAHLLSTGQGVVMDRSVYSDFVFLEAMAKEGYVSKKVRSFYYEIKKQTMKELIRPHLIVYLDIPVPRVQEKIKQRGLPYEVNSNALSTPYLSNIEDFYKRHFLNEISQHAELLIYDWSDEGDVEVVIEDIERIDFDKYTRHDTKMSDWNIRREQTWADLRMLYADNKSRLFSKFNIPRLDCPELLMTAEEQKIRMDVWDMAPGQRYIKGYNQDQGDTGILTKMHFPKITLKY